MSRRVTKAIASVLASKYSHAIYDKRCNERKEKLFAMAMELYVKYIPLGFRAALNTYKEFYHGSSNITFQCEASAITIWFDDFRICPNLKRIKISYDEFNTLKELKARKDYICNYRLVFERTATENFYKLKTLDNVKKYFPEVAEYIPKEVDEPKELGVEDLKKMVKEAKEGGES